jgi:hypothetical protein
MLLHNGRSFREGLSGNHTLRTRKRFPVCIPAGVSYAPPGGGIVTVVDDVRDQLRRASAKYLKTGQERDAAQEALVAVVVAALRQGLTPTEVVELSPYSPAYIRKIARQHQIPAAPLGRKSRTKQQ